MGLLTESLITLIELTKTLHGEGIDPTIADTAIKEVVSAVVDMVPFPIQASVLGIIQLNISRAEMDTALDKIRAAIKTYVYLTV